MYKHLSAKEKRYNTLSIIPCQYLQWRKNVGLQGLVPPLNFGEASSLVHMIAIGATPFPPPPPIQKHHPVPMSSIPQQREY